MTEYTEIPPGRTVADLIEQLSTLDPTLPVVQSSDAEGNSYNYWCGDVAEAIFEGTYNGDITLTPEQYEAEMAKPEAQRTYGEDDEPAEVGGDVRRVVVLWPI